MKYISTLFCLFSLFSYSQNNYEGAFKDYLNYAGVVFKIPEGFEQVPSIKSENFVSHPNLHSIRIMNFILNKEKNVKIGLEAMPFNMNGKKIFEDSEIPKCVLLDNYDVSQGKVLMYGRDMPKNYNVDLHANYPVRLFDKYQGEYDFCREIYLQNNEKGRVIILFFYNEKQREYVSELSLRFYEYLKFAK